MTVKRGFRWFVDGLGRKEIKVIKNVPRFYLGSLGLGKAKLDLRNEKNIKNNFIFWVFNRPLFYRLQSQKLKQAGNFFPLRQKSMEIGHSQAELGPHNGVKIWIPPKDLDSSSSTSEQS